MSAEIGDVFEFSFHFVVFSVDNQIWVVIHLILTLIILLEERMSKCSLDGDSLGGLKLHHLGKEIDGLGVSIKIGAELDQVLISIDSPFWESGFHFW